MKSFNFKGNTVNHGSKVIITYKHGERLYDVKGEVYIDTSDVLGNKLFVLTNARHLSGAYPEGNKEILHRKGWDYSWWTADSYHDRDEIYTTAKILKVALDSFDTYRII